MGAFFFRRTGISLLCSLFCFAVSFSAQSSFAGMKLAISGQTEVSDSGGLKEKAMEVTPEEIYGRMPTEFFRTDHQQIGETLQSRAEAPQDFIQRLNREGFDFLCVGETHRESFRQHLLKYVLDGLEFDHFFLEARPDRLSTMLSQYRETGELRFLGAPFGFVLDALLAANPNLSLRAVEHTRAQALRITQESIVMDRQLLSRDGFIAKNILSEWQVGERHVALYGASHCSLVNEGLGFGMPFYRFLRDSKDSWSEGLLAAEPRMHSIKVVYLDENLTLRGFLGRYGLGQEPVILRDLSSLDPRSYNYQQEIKALFESYDHLLFVPSPSYGLEPRWVERVR